MLEQIKQIKHNFEQQFKEVKTLSEIQVLKKEYLGKDSPLITILKSMRDADEQTKQEIGKQANLLLVEIANQLNELGETLNNEILNEQLKGERIDVSLPGMNLKFGSKHPLNLVIDEISQIFTEIGFEMVDGTEVEQDEFNFQKLNLPKDHPARDMQDTFYLDEESVLRTHCTNMTSRLLTKLANQRTDNQNLAAISYGNVYRRDDDDATHSHQFMQIDGFAVGEKISFANLKWVLRHMVKRLFNEKVNIRLRPSFFPFTEPSVEVDISCFKCAGVGCGLCKSSGWIEILGAGMINQQVMELNGLDPNKVTGLAFGIGIERIAMLKFGINNIRLFYENNVEFLTQFPFYGK
ncbi:phenylalanyl-tRNA synthetase subunit alpha [Williamsoniiplasma luminosum]|uniref:Phenylalanine--tRNA ligase alpha subunit n=1 Tax=Williamsoniiplasma luminosum TaxID=214888 RepID=A0A2K8NTN2_9MOLU|nr:phenylalanine--tRNA ligase subunit alpha [Williamsoniiplasma luminosum]ATZ17149.1 phenylalanyl-tRNA synthetase subunit alpha [Williamsoniiplasma luminosum]